MSNALDVHVRCALRSQSMPLHKRPALAPGGDHHDAVERRDAILLYRGTSLTRKRTPLRPYRTPMPRVLGGSKGGGRSLVGEVPL